MALPILHHATRWWTVGVCAFIVVAVLTPSLGGFDPSTFGAWHPVFMTLGVVGFMSLGVVSYVSDYGGLVNRRFPDRGSRRLLHGVLQMIAGALVLVGYLIHFTYAQAKGYSHIGAGQPTWRQVHVWAGILTVAGVVAQV
jgi:hypothetical protein